MLAAKSLLARRQVGHGRRLISTSSRRDGWCPGLTTLAIETSCDDTSVAVLQLSGHQHDAVQQSPKLTARTIFHKKITSNSEAYNGIHPLVALHSHQRSLAPLVQEATTAIHNEGISTSNSEMFVSATRGPGMRSNLTVGLELAKGLSVAWGVPLVGVHHMQAHALTPRLCAAVAQDAEIHAPSWSPSTLEPRFPYLSVLASGGHTMLVNSSTLTDHFILAETVDIAIGDCLDKCARAILPSDLLKPPYGKALEEFAFPNGESDYAYTAPINRQQELTRRPTRWNWALGIPLSDSRLMAYSFAGLTTSVQRFMARVVNADGSLSSKARSEEEVSMEERRDMAREVQRIAFEHLGSRILLHLSSLPKHKVGAESINTVVVSGGVASNRYLRHVLREMLNARGYKHMKLSFPPPSLCTDNALMIAWAGLEMFAAGYRSSLDITPIRKWPMDPSSPEGGILGATGWLRDTIPKVNDVIARSTQS